MEQLARIQPPEAVLAVRQTCEVRLSSTHLTGTFDAVLLVARDGAVRLQLFPDIGGKVLDLVATAERITGVIPQAGITYECATAADTKERHLLLFFAITLLERSTPITHARVLGVRERELLLAPRVPGSEVIAELDDEGRVRARRYLFRHVAWREELGAETTIAGEGFTLRAKVLESEPADG